MVDGRPRLYDATRAKTHDAFRTTAGARLGVVTEGSLTKGLTARLDVACSVEDVRVGRFVKIEGEKYDFFCLVTDVALGTASPGVLQDPPEPDDEFLRDVLSGTTTFGSVVIAPMLMLNKQAVDEVASVDEIGAGPQPVRTIPVHFAPVNAAEEEDFNRVFAEPGEGSWIIGSPRDMDIPVRLDLTRLAERSNGIFGKSGTGKSMLTRLLLCGLIRSRRAVNLVFDMHSEYAWSYPDRASGKMLRSLKELFGHNVAVYTLRSSRPRPSSHRSDGDIYVGLNEFEIDDIALISDLLNLNETAIETIYLLQAQYGDRWLIELLGMAQEDIKEFCERSNAHPLAVSALNRKLKQLQQLDFVDSNYIDPKRSAIANVVKSLEDGSNVVLAFEHESQLLPYMLVANLITRRLHDRWVELTTHAQAGSGSPPHPLVITIEEAHKFLSTAAARYTRFGTIARELRKFNVTLLVVDQRPSGIDTEVLSQFGTRLTCQLNDENDVSAILAGVSGTSHLRSVLASLDSQQEVMLLGHAVPMPVVVRTRTIDDAFYAEVTSGPNGHVVPTGRAARELASPPDD